MSNSRIFQASYPAERMRGCKFATDFRDPLVMARDGWTAFGAPLYHPDGGVILNGTTQRLAYPLAKELYSPSITMHWEVYPTFAPNDGVTHYLGSTSGGGFSLYKSSTGSLTVILGGTTQLVSALASYQAYWVTGGRNLISMSIINGAQILWLNGNEIDTSAAVYTPTSDTTLNIGANATPIPSFAGRITRLYIGHHTSTLAEHTAYWNNSMWSWRNRATVDLQFRTADYDIGNVRTLDSSGHALHATLGDGVTPAKYPSQGRGQMTFDGADYLSCADAPVLRLTNTGAVFIAYKVTASPSYIALCGKSNFATGKYGYLLYLDNATRRLKGQIATAATPCAVASSAYPSLGPVYTSAMTWDGTTLEIFHNGISVGSTPQTVNAVDNGYPYRIGSGSAAEGYYLTGSVYENMVFATALNHTQILDAHLSFLSGLGAKI